MPTPGDDDSGWSSAECRLRDLLIEGTALGVEQGAIPYEYLEYLTSSSEYLWYLMLSK